MNAAPVFSLNCLVLNSAAMKILFVLLVAVLPITGFCQFEGKQVIKINGLGLDQLVKGLLDAGYSIEKSEASLSVIVTHIKQSPATGIGTLIKAKLQGGNVLLSGQYSEPGKTAETCPITDSGSPGSPCMTSWKLMQDLAESFNKPMEIL